ncbi:MAG: ATP-binding cassette domain-containing protein [Pseudomonadales bacterium]|nr:ATP-binding cassette domain-containing protein [Pseudomonadales bacterium]
MIEILRKSLNRITRNDHTIDSDLLHATADSVLVKEGHSAIAHEVADDLPALRFLYRVLMVASELATLNMTYSMLNGNSETLFISAIIYAITRATGIHYSNVSQEKVSEVLELVVDALDEHPIKSDSDQPANREFRIPFDQLAAIANNERFSHLNPWEQLFWLALQFATISSQSPEIIPVALAAWTLCSIDLFFSGKAYKWAHNNVVHYRSIAKDRLSRFSHLTPKEDAKKKQLSGRRNATVDLINLTSYGLPFLFLALSAIEQVGNVVAGAAIIGSKMLGSLSSAVNTKENRINGQNASTTLGKINEKVKNGGRIFVATEGEQQFRRNRDNQEQNLVQKPELNLNTKLLVEKLDVIAPNGQKLFVLDGRIELTCEGKGLLTLISGSSGSGKTTLLAALTETSSACQCGRIQLELTEDKTKIRLIDLPVEQLKKIFVFCDGRLPNQSLIDSLVSPDKREFDNLSEAEKEQVARFSWRELKQFAATNVNINAIVENIRHQATEIMEESRLFSNNEIPGLLDANNLSDASSGQKRRLALLLASREAQANQGVLFIDEPLAKLDNETAQSNTRLVINFIKRLLKMGIPVIMTDNSAPELIMRSFIEYLATQIKLKDNFATILTYPSVVAGLKKHSTTGKDTEIKAKYLIGTKVRDQEDDLLKHINGPYRQELMHTPPDYQMKIIREAMDKNEECRVVLGKCSSLWNSLENSQTELTQEENDTYLSILAIYRHLAASICVDLIDMMQSDSSDNNYKLPQDYQVFLSHLDKLKTNLLSLTEFLLASTVNLDSQEYLLFPYQTTQSLILEMLNKLIATINNDDAGTRNILIPTSWRSEENCLNTVLQEITRAKLEALSSYKKVREHFSTGINMGFNRINDRNKHNATNPLDPHGFMAYHKLDRSKRSYLPKITDVLAKKSHDQLRLLHPHSPTLRVLTLLHIEQSLLGPNHSLRNPLLSQFNAVGYYEATKGINYRDYAPELTKAQTIFLPTPYLEYPKGLVIDISKLIRDLNMNLVEITLRDTPDSDSNPITILHQAKHDLINYSNNVNNVILLNILNIGPISTQEVEEFLRERCKIAEGKTIIVLMLEHSDVYHRTPINTVVISPGLDPWEGQKRANPTTEQIVYQPDILHTLYPGFIDFDYKKLLSICRYVDEGPWIDDTYLWDPEYQRMIAQWKKSREKIVQDDPISMTQIDSFSSFGIPFKTWICYLLHKKSPQRFRFTIDEELEPLLHRDD